MSSSSFHNINLILEILSRESLKKIFQDHLPGNYFISIYKFPQFHFWNFLVLGTV